MEDLPYPEDRQWMNFAACRDKDPDIFFPGDGGGIGEAKRICRTCPAQKACLDYALTHGEDKGIWGGTSERERRRILRRRRLRRVA